MPNGYHEDHRSLKQLARAVHAGGLRVDAFYEIAAERLVDSKRAEALLIDAKTQLDAERQALGDDQIDLPLAILVKPQPISVKVGAIDV